MAWSVEQMAELGMRHSTLEAQGKLEPLLETLIEDPVYEFQPIGLGMRGGDMVRRFYTQFFTDFVPLRHSYRLLSEWVSEQSVAQEYEIALKLGNEVEHFRVIGILYAAGELLGGERVYASDRFIRLMTGALFDELTPLQG